MPRMTALAAASALAGLMLAAPLAQAGADPTGIWLDDSGRGAIEIKPCGDKLCGHLVWVKDASDSKRGCGKQIIGDVKPAGGGRWDYGWVYSPEKKRNYDVELKPLDNGNLRVTGYAGVKFLSKTMIWTPAPADLQRCGTSEAKAAPTETTKSATVDKAPDVSSAKSANDETKPVAPTESKTAPQPQAAEAPTVLTPQKEAANDVPADNDGEGEGRGLGGLKLGDLDLDKVLTRTKSGKCKLDTPWIKMQFECDRGG